MIVRMAILSAVGEAIIEVPEATDLDTVRKAIREGNCIIHQQNINQIKYNFDTIEVHPSPEKTTA